MTAVADVGRVGSGAAAAAVLAERAPGFAPRLGLVLGSGLGALADALSGAITAQGMGGEELSHEQTLRHAALAADDRARLIAEFCEERSR